jgi:DNA-binding transcriptional regulator GbsR (MarR family)
MPKIQKCRNACGTDITVLLDTQTGKYKPYELNQETDEWDIIHQCPNNPYYAAPQTKSQFLTKREPLVKEISTTATDTSSSSSSSSLDIKRMKVMMDEILKELKDIKALINARTILDTTKYEGRTDQIFQAWQPFFSTQGTIASEIDTSSINHGKKVDEYLENRIPDDEDEKRGAGAAGETEED